MQALMTPPHRWMFVVAPVLSAVLVGFATCAEGQAGPGQKPSPSRDTADKDYGSELPRFPLKAPADSQRALVPRPGFHVDLVAAEPLVAESRRHRHSTRTPASTSRSSPSTTRTSAPTRIAARRGCVRLLEDTRGVGVYDKSTLFAENVPMATAVACWDGGVYVGSAPDLLYLKDTDGDGKADVRRVVFTGFGTDRAGEGMLNSFRWGLENRFHVSTSLDGGSVRRGRSRGGPDGLGPRIWLPLQPTGRDLRAHRRRRSARDESG